MAPQKYGKDKEATARAKESYEHAKRRQKHRLSELDSFVVSECKRLCLLRKKMLGGEWQMDHIVPLQHKGACGLHTACNLQCVPMRWNKSKSNLHFEVWRP